MTGSLRGGHQHAHTNSPPARSRGARPGRRPRARGLRQLGQLQRLVGLGGQRRRIRILNDDVEGRDDDIRRRCAWAVARASTVKLSADPNGALAFTATRLTAKAGKVTLDMANPESAGHPACDRGRGQRGRRGWSDGAAWWLVEGHGHAEARDLRVLLPIPGHKAAGMEGTLTVS